MLSRNDGGRGQSGGLGGRHLHRGGVAVRLWPVGDPLRLRPCRRPLDPRLPRQGTQELLVHGGCVHDDFAGGRRWGVVVGAWSLRLTGGAI